MSEYDYGLRGPPYTTRPRFSGRGYPRYGGEREPIRGSPWRGESIDARYDRDYLYPSGGEISGKSLPVWSGRLRPFRGRRRLSPSLLDYRRHPDLSRNPR